MALSDQDVQKQVSHQPISKGLRDFIEITIFACKNGFKNLTDGFAPIMFGQLYI